MSIQVKPHKGRLAFQCRWKGMRRWVGTTLPDTPENVAVMKAYATLISADLAAGMLLRDAIRKRTGVTPDGYFPDEDGGTGEGEGERTIAALVVKFERYMAKETELRAATRYQRSRYLNRLFVPRFGKLRLEELTPGMLSEFRQELIDKGLRGRPLKLGSIKTIMSSHFSAFWSWAAKDHNFRAAQSGGRVLPSPFSELEWPRPGRYHADPFTLAERDLILAWFHERLPHWHPWVAFLFWTGCRPSEAAGLTYGTVDLEEGTAHIRRSRVKRILGDDTKTYGSDRTIPLFPALLAILRDRKVERLNPQPDDAYFVEPDGREVDQDRFGYRHFSRCLRSLNIRTRGIYSTRDTFISHALTAGRPPQAIAEHCGTSLTMMSKHYAKYMRVGGLEPFGETSNERQTMAKKSNKD